MVGKHLPKNSSSSPFPSSTLVSFESVDPDVVLAQDLVQLDESFILSLRSSSRQKIALLTDKAIRTLNRGLDSGDLKVAITAANSILDRDGLSKPQSIFTDDSSFAPSVVLGALLGAAKVMGVSLDENSARKTLMEVEAKDGRSSVSVSLASEAMNIAPKNEGPLRAKRVSLLTPLTSLAPLPLSQPSQETRVESEEKEISASEIPSELLESLSKEKH